jgi:23S rRNA (adenine2503-C2)-methyltransferase
LSGFFLFYWPTANANAIKSLGKILLLYLCTVIDNKIDIRKLNLAQLKDHFETMGEKSFRATQVYQWIWKNSALSFDAMTNLSLPLRELLNKQFFIDGISTDDVQRSKDGTIKSRFTLIDGYKIEGVLIPTEKRATACVSSQVGCSLTCKFCATGQMDRKRNLSAGEIYDQVVAINQQSLEKYERPLTNIVYMGMGEPLLNYANVLESIEKITSPEGLGISTKRITVSTAGVAKMIKKLADDGVKFNLALSLHAANDNKRDQIMPINESNKLDVLMEALQYFYDKTGNEITYEYIAFDGFNDSIDDARQLLALCRNFPVKVNIIEYNKVENVVYNKASQEKVDAFAAYLESNRIVCNVRRSRGKDIDAACGQLANKG